MRLHEGPITFLGSVGSFLVTGGADGMVRPHAARAACGGVVSLTAGLRGPGGMQASEHARVMGRVGGWRAAGACVAVWPASTAVPTPLCAGHQVRFYDASLRLAAWFDELQAGPVSAVSFSTAGVGSPEARTKLNRRGCRTNRPA